MDNKGNKKSCFQFETFPRYFFILWISYIQTKYNQKLQSPGALNIKETPGYKQKENVKKEC